MQQEYFKKRAMNEEKLGLARLCRSFELASLEKGYVKKALDAYVLAQNAR
jgi:hypothetical protein